MRFNYYILFIFSEFKKGSTILKDIPLQLSPISSSKYLKYNYTDSTVVCNFESNLPFEDLGWKEATIKNTVPADASDFKEYLYEIESLEDFNTFSIKIVLQSDNSANIPFVENFRAIALSV